jgi:HD-like signal output (HDOD) protein
VLAAGVVHDLGLYILADRFEAEYLRARALAARSKTTVGQAVRRLYGVSVTDLSARALEAWRFPSFFFESVRCLEWPEQAGPEEIATTSMLLADTMANSHGYAFEDWEFSTDSPLESQHLARFGTEEAEFVFAAVRRHVEGLLEFWGDDIDQVGAIA